MNKIDRTALAPRKGCGYPTPFDVPCRERVRQALSDAARLTDFVTKLKSDNKNVYLEIQGHTDNVGEAGYNLKLSQSRADAVRKYLTSHGIAPDRLTAKGFGATQPIVPNTTEGNRALNRRVQFIRTESRP